MSGKTKGTAARITQRFPKALYYHCVAHILNLYVVKSCSVQELRSIVEEFAVRLCTWDTHRTFPRTVMIHFRGAKYHSKVLFTRIYHLRHSTFGKCLLITSLNTYRGFFAHKKHPKLKLFSLFLARLYLKVIILIRNFSIF